MAPAELLLPESRSDPLAPLLAPLAALPGIGPALARLLARAIDGERVLDLLLHLPDETLIDRRERPTVDQARPGSIATLALRVVDVRAPSHGRAPWRVRGADASGTIELSFFARGRPKLATPGLDIVASGRIELYGGRPVMTNPDHVVLAAQADTIPALEPVWPLTAGLSGRMLGRAMAAALACLPELPEWQDAAVLRTQHWPGFAEALGLLHAPERALAALSPGDIHTRQARARARLAADELLADALARAEAKRVQRDRPGRALTGDGTLRDEALRRFGHPPTPSQTRALAEIDADLAAPTRMLRLLQGDVGAGKTLVATLAMLRAVEAGAQAALMAPTEILARQHHRTLSSLCATPVGLLTGSVKGAARTKLLRGVADGGLRLVVGTHALFQSGVRFADLGLAVIDEQHRFGVEQRLQLGEKGETTDVLVMTATPIPRTLLLTQWSEMAVSRLSGKPAGRQPIRTTLHSIGAMAALIAAIARALDGGAQVFWVCPLVAQGDPADLAAAGAAAEERHRKLLKHFPSIGLAHGQMPAELREAALRDFAEGRTRLLVATTVIEVGVDVPQASVMVVEHAERFGLAQLHQLRGRVGRGAAQSYCLLLHDDELTASARRRLALLRDTEDGFVIADEDFRLRGGGDLLGRRQSGQAAWRVAGGFLDETSLRRAWQDAERVIEADPELSDGRGRDLRTLLRVFGRDDVLRTLHSG